MSYRKLLALFLAMTLVLQAVPLSASDTGRDFSFPLAVFWDGADAADILSHFSAFTGIAGWIYSNIYEAYMKLNEDGFLDLLFGIFDLMMDHMRERGDGVYTL